MRLPQRLTMDPDLHQGDGAGGADGGVKLLKLLGLSGTQHDHLVILKFVQDPSCGECGDDKRRREFL